MPGAATLSPDPRGSSAPRPFGRAVLHGLGAYFLGIVACLALTPAATELAGAQLWYWYPVFAPIAFFLFYFYLSAPYLPAGAEGLAYWIWFTIGVVPLCGEATGWLEPTLRRWRPYWIGFPVGFVGTLGVFYTAASSI